MREHNSNRTSHAFTNRHKPWILAYYEAYSDELDAKEREMALKKYGSTLGHLRKRLKRSLERAGENLSPRDVVLRPLSSAFACQSKPCAEAGVSAKALCGGWRTPHREHKIPEARTRASGILLLKIFSRLTRRCISYDISYEMQETAYISINRYGRHSQIISKKTLKSSLRLCAGMN